MLTLNSALDFINENVQNQRLIKHMKVVSICTKYYAKSIKNGTIVLPDISKDEIEEIDIVEWELAGLLHDADWESEPTKHPAVVVAWLMEQDAPINIIKSIHSHANVDWAISQPGGNIALVTIGGEHQEIPRVIPRDTLIGKVLFACDEMSGMIYATALMKPDKLASLEVGSVMKKIKEKKFAAGVNREELVQGCEEIGLSMEEHIGNLIQALKQSGEEIFD